MSTKIYHAYRLHDGTDIFQLRRDMRNRFADRLLIDTMQHLLQDAVYQFDERHRNDPDYTLRKAVAELCKEFNDDKPNALASTQAVLLDNPVRNEVYMLLYGELRRIDSDEILALPGVRDRFDYWDNTDQPADMSDAAWLDRALAWEEAFTDMRASVASQGLQITLFSGYEAYLDVSRMRAAWASLTVPTLDQRCDRLGCSQHIIAYLAENDINKSETVVEVSRQLRMWASGEVDRTRREIFKTRAATTLVQQLDLRG